MKLYDKVIADAAAVLRDLPVSCFPYEKGRMWKDLGSSKFIMQRDAALELGSGGAPSVNFTCATTSGLIGKDEVCVFGPDLPDLESGCAFARIAPAFFRAA